jgi:putative nucleotidyltransferase with HDIG domain
MERIADAVDLRDTYTGHHSRRVTEYTERILRQLNLSGPAATLIITAARVHDIGKVDVPDNILKKEGPLTESEWVMMKAHAEHGAELLARHPAFKPCADIVRHHHERMDGKGYPDGLQGYAIPWGARVIAVADSYDAMTSDRPYRRGMSPTRATQILAEGRGTQWDPMIVDALLQCIADLIEQPTPSHTPFMPQWVSSPMGAAA